MNDIAPSRSSNKLEDLFYELLGLRADMMSEADRRLQSIELLPGQQNTGTSRINLAHYLAFRSHDLRSLQDKLTKAGLSSMAHGETDVLGNIDRVIEVLSALTSIPLPEDLLLHDDRYNDIGGQCLQERVNALFGDARADRSTRIMVTMSIEMAYEYKLVKKLVASGVECVRINCAHDGPDIWQKMIDHVHRACAETGETCKIMMGLAGHKIRTAQVRSENPVIHVRRSYDEVLHQQVARLVLMVAGFDHRDEKLEVVPVEQELYETLRAGDRLLFTDIYGKKRKLRVEFIADKQQWQCYSRKDVYITSNTELQLQRKSEQGDWHDLDFYEVGDIALMSNKITVHKNERIFLSAQETLDNGNIQSDSARIEVTCTLPQVIGQLSVDEQVWFDDGKLGGVIESVSPEGVVVHITDATSKGFQLRCNKGINFPDTYLDLPALTEKDLEDLAFAALYSDMIGFSFVQKPQDITDLVAELQKYDGPRIPIVVKIETKMAVDNLPSILLSHVDHYPLAIMIARGDLAVELGSVRMAEIQEEILWLSEAAHVPVIWATQVLESLAKKGRTSRGEITDAAMSVRAECVMMNKGPYILEAVRVLKNILKRMEHHQYKKTARMRALHF